MNAFNTGSRLPRWLTPPNDRLRAENRPPGSCNYRRRKKTTEAGLLGAKRLIAQPAACFTLLREHMCFTHSVPAESGFLVLRGLFIRNQENRPPGSL